MARTAFGVALFSALAAAAPAALAPLQASGEAIPGQYIVKLKDDVMTVNTASILGGAIANNITHTYDSVFKGYAGKFDAATVAALRALPTVEYVEQDSMMHAIGVQNGADYGLAITSANSKLGTSSQSTYYYADNTGSGTYVYVVDTGILTSHNDFGGRAQFVANYISGSPNTDENGHGTHCAGTVGGSTYGVAKSANLRAVKVLDKSGSGATSGIVSGIQYVVNNCPSRGKCVISMSLGGGYSSSLNNAVASAVNNQVTVVVAAGNENQNACNVSPASEPSAITVAAIDNTYTRASFSNYGSCVDIFAPGVNIKSDWIGSNSATNTISGTSMACPHIAGLASYFASQGYTGPSAILNQIKAKADSGYVSGTNGSPNLVGNNGARK